MIIKNQMSAARLTKEVTQIRQDIVEFLLAEIERKGLTVERVAKLIRANENKFLDGSLSLTQLLKLCFYLEISPAYIMTKYYDHHEVVIK